MNAVNIAKTFSSSAADLTAVERGRILDFLTKFMLDPTAPGLHLEKISDTKGASVKSARITKELRTILHQDGSQFTLLYAGHHDDAYDWASRRRIENHPATGSLQIVEAAETVDLPTFEQPKDEKKLFADHGDEYLLSLGVPEDWLFVLRKIVTEDDLLSVVTKLPEEVAERLLGVAAGELVTPPAPIAKEAPLQQSPDNLRRFWVVESAAELRDVLERPIEDWVRFLHPSQRDIVTKTFNGPAKVSGAAGTGKTVVGLHRAKALAAKGRRVLFTSFVKTLCRNIEHNIQVLCAQSQADPPTQLKDRITVSTVHSLALKLAKQVNDRVAIISDDDIAKLIKRRHAGGGFQFDTGFLESEWEAVIERQGIATWEQYRKAQRTGRGKPLSVRQRKDCWTVFDGVLQDLRNSARYTWSGICSVAMQGLDEGVISSPFDAVIVDEVQDLQPQELRLLAALTKDEPGNLMLLGDAGQRIYPGGFSLSKLGINVRGRSHVLRINYRTTEQIRRFADQLLSPESDDLDEGTEARSSHSLLKGPAPVINGFKTQPMQDEFVVQQIQRVLQEGIQPRAIAVFARTKSQLKDTEKALRSANIPVFEVGPEVDLSNSLGVNLATMHRAKGLEFKVVFVVNASNDIVPHRYSLSRLKDAGDYDAALERERQLLYVAVTRARDEAFITWVGDKSEFL